MIKTAVCGIGRMGLYHLAVHNKIENESDDIKIVAICDAEPHRLCGGGSARVNLGDNTDAIDFSRYAHYTDLDEMLEKEKPDIVDIVLPTYLHCEAAVKVLKRGINCFCEKPMALNEEECRRMQEASRESGKLLMIGHCLRFWREYVFLKNCVQNGAYGAVRGAYFWRGGFQDHIKNPSWQNWIITKEKGGGALFDQHIHDTDAINWIFGTPETVSVLGKTVFPESAFDIVSASYVYPDKVITALDDITYKGLPFEYGYKVNFEHATAVYSGGILTVYPEEGLPFRPDFTDMPALTADAYYNELKYFYGCVRDGRETDAIPASESADAVRIALAEAKSAASGGSFTATKQKG